MMEYLTNPIFWFIVIQSLAILWLIRKVQKPVIMQKPKIEEEDELDLKGLGEAIYKFEPAILRYMVKKSNPETEEDRRKEQTLKDLLEGIAELLKSDAIPSLWKGLKKMMK